MPVVTVPVCCERMDSSTLAATPQLGTSTLLSRRIPKRRVRGCKHASRVLSIHHCVLSLSLALSFVSSASCAYTILRRRTPTRSACHAGRKRLQHLSVFASAGGKKESEALSSLNSPQENKYAAAMFPIRRSLWKTKSSACECSSGTN